MGEAGEEEDLELELAEDPKRGEWSYQCPSPTQPAQDPGPLVPLSAQPRAQFLEFKDRKNGVRELLYAFPE